MDALIKPFLLEDDAIVNAGDLAVLSVLSREHLAMIGFGPSRQGGLQIVADRPHVQLVQLAALGWSQQANQFVVAQLDFGSGVEVEITGDAFDGSILGTSKHLVEQVVGGDQMVVDGVSQVRQVGPAEGTVPVAAVALAAVQFASRVGQRLPPRNPARGRLAVAD